MCACDPGAGSGCDDVACARPVLSRHSNLPCFEVTAFEDMLNQQSRLRAAFHLSGECKAAGAPEQQ